MGSCLGSSVQKNKTVSLCKILDAHSPKSWSVAPQTRGLSVAQIREAAWEFFGLGEGPGLCDLLQGGNHLLAPLWTLAQVELVPRKGRATEFFLSKTEKFVCSRRNVPTEMTHERADRSA